MRHPLAVAGALITTASAVVFIALLIAAFAGLLDNPYAGLVVFVAIPALFVSGLLLVAAGMWRQQRLSIADAAAADWPVLDFRRPEIRRNVVLFTVLTSTNLIIVLVAGYGSLHWMESPSFCGQVCHTPMHPQFTAWSGASHAGVACVECHIGEGPGALVHAKLAGVRQLVQVATNSFPRPIPPGAQLPEGEQARTCLECHRPAAAVGDQIRVIREYADDEKSSETLTVLQMYLGAGSATGRAIHWHADPAVRIEYVATDETLQTIPYVRLTDAAGRTTEYRTPDATDQLIATGTRRMMDCVDCHNTVGHPIAQTPERAVDGAIAAAQISRDLPFARRESLRLVKASYASQAEALGAIERGLREFYASQPGGIDRQAVDRTVAGAQGVYRRNVFPAMKVTWGAYPDSNGHVDSPGCVRCHDDSHEANGGRTISGDCEYCHRQIER